MIRIWSATFGRRWQISRDTDINEPGACCAGHLRQLSPPINVKRVYRVMRSDGCCWLERARLTRLEHRHDGKMTFERSNKRWCSDGFAFCCDNGEPLRVTFALYRWDSDAIRWAATKTGHSGDVVRDEMLTAVERRFGGLSVISCSRHNMRPRSIYATQPEVQAGGSAGYSP